MEMLDKLLAKLSIKLDAVISLDIPTQVVLDRLTTRRTCSNAACQAIYNVKSMPPKTEGICDKCGQPVIQRSDETEEAIMNALIAGRDMTGDLGHYAKGIDHSKLQEILRQHGRLVTN